MSYDHPTFDESDEHGALHVALVELAATMPDDQFLNGGIHTKARRLRTRRRVWRGSVIGIAGAATLATLVAVHPGPTRVSILPAAGEPTTASAAPSVPTCGAVLAALPPGSLIPPTAARSSAASGSAADAAKLAASDTADAANHAATGLRGVKGAGTIVRATDSSVTFTVEVADPGQPAEITATIAPDVVYADGDTKLAGRPPLDAGEEVFFAVTEADDGSRQLIYLEVHPSSVEPRSDGTVDPGAKAAAAAAGLMDVKGLAEIISVQPGSISVKLRGTGQVVTAATGPDTIYSAGPQKCVAPELAAGMTVAVLLVRGGDGAYTARYVSLFQNA